MLLFPFKMTQIENVDYYFVYASEVLGITCYLKRVNAHAERREQSTSVLDNFV